MLTDKKKIEFVISNFHDLENQLIDCLSYIPYVEQNKNSISPKFVPIILESCSLIESIFKDTLEDGKYNFKSYFKEIECKLDLNDTISILLTSPIQFLKPFQCWNQHIPNWWNIYNKLKHDRLNNIHLVTYDVTVLSLAALHQVISKHRGFTNHIIERSWIPPDSVMLPELIGSRLIGDTCVPINIIPCESKLFVSPLHSNIVEITNSNYFIRQDCEFSSKIQNIIDIYELGL